MLEFEPRIKRKDQTFQTSAVGKYWMTAADAENPTPLASQPADVV